MTLLVHIPQTSESHQAILKDNLDSTIQLITGEADDTEAVDVLVAGRPQNLPAYPNLRYLIIPFAGLPETTRDLMLDYPHVSVHNLHHNDVPTAEHAVTLMMAACRKLIWLDDTFRNHDWTPRYEPGRMVLLHGKTMLILGYGTVGRQVAKLCSGFSMNIIGVKRTPADDDDYATIRTTDALHDLLPQTDILMVCAPLTPETQGIIGEKELHLMPPGGVVVNVARGEVIEEAALYHALKDGHLHSAGLDVWYQYPADKESRTHTPPSEYPFHELPNVVMTPHRAGFLDHSEVEQWRMEHLAALLNAIARGEPVPNRVNVEAGY
jgi:phosphoglycerate dehydrogenase-like enzyme